MGAEELQTLQRLMQTANQKHGGNLAILKSGSLWRVSFATPNDKAEIAAMPQGRTFAEAAKLLLDGDAKPV